MNVAVFDLAQPSLIVADLINRFYGEWFEKNNGGENMWQNKSSGHRIVVFQMFFSLQQNSIGCIGKP